MGDRETVNHARVLIEADLVTKLDELLGSLSLHQKLVALDRQLASDPSAVNADVESGSQEILARVSSRLNRQYHVFRSTMEQLPKSTDLFTHFLPQYDDIQARLCADLESLETPLLAITRGSSTADPPLQHDLIRDTLSRSQLIVSQGSSRASLSLEQTISVGADQLLFFIQAVIIGLAVLMSVFIVLLLQWRDRAQVRESAAEAYESLVGVMEFMDPSWAIDTSGTVIYWNRAVEKLTGIPADEMIGKSNHEYALPFYGERRKVLIDLILEWDETIQEKYVFIDKLEDGSISAASFHPDLGTGTYLASSAQLLKTSSGKVIGAIETVKDITEQTQSQEELFRLKGEGQQALRLAEERLSALQSVRETSVDAMITFDVEKNIRSANPAVERIFGYSPSELIGRSMRMICDSDYPTSTDQSEPVEVEGLHNDGSRIPISVSVSQIIEDGEAVTLVTIRDLRAAREQEKQISHLENLLSLKSLDFINQGISVFDRDLKLLSANQPFLEIQNFPPRLGEPGTKMEDMFRFNAERGEYGEGDIEQQVQDRLALAKKFEAHEFERTRKDGVIIHIAGTPIDEGIGGFITVYTDVTKSRRYEEQQQQEIKQLESVLHLE
ncbi:MAG: PAS-domain containing protein, partial [Pseudomonadota bacterium]|nr:PAS-domain containing protein [Pseudomonadota bacterium]